MATKEIRTIALSEDTAELLTAKKMLDECFKIVSDVHEKYNGYDREFEFKWYDAFCDMNNIIMDLLTEQIDINSTESHYKVI